MSRFRGWKLVAIALVSTSALIATSAGTALMATSVLSETSAAADQPAPTVGDSSRPDVTSLWTEPGITAILFGADGTPRIQTEHSLPARWAPTSLPGRWAAAHSSSATPTPPPYQAPHIEGVTAVIDRVTVIVSHKTPIETPNFLGTGFQVVVQNDSGAELTAAVGDVQQAVPNASSLAFSDLVRFPGLSTRSVPVRVGAQRQDLDVVPL